MTTIFEAIASLPLPEGYAWRICHNDAGEIVEAFGHWSGSFSRYNVARLALIGKWRTDVQPGEHAGEWLATIDDGGGCPAGRAFHADPVEAFRRAALSAHRHDLAPVSALFALGAS